MYKERDVVGMICDEKKFSIEPARVTVRFTSDAKGKTLSLSAYNIMIAVPIESIKDIIEECSNEK